MQMSCVWDDLTRLKEPKRPGQLEPGDPDGHEKLQERSETREGKLECQLDFTLQTMGTI